MDPSPQRSGFICRCSDQGVVGVFGVRHHFQLQCTPPSGFLCLPAPDAIRLADEIVVLHNFDVYPARKLLIANGAVIGRAQSFRTGSKSACGCDRLHSRDCSAGRYDQCGSIIGEPDGAVRPVEPDQLHPFPQPLAKVPVARVFGDAKLRGESEVAEQWHALCPFRLMASPAKPHIQIEAARDVRQLTNNPHVDRNRMRLNLLPERLAQVDHVARRARFSLICRPTAPDAQPVEEVEPPADPNFLSAAGIVGSEIDSAGEYSLETFDQPTVVRSILRQMNSSRISAADRNRTVRLFCRTARVAIQSGISRSCPNGSP